MSDSPRSDTPTLIEALRILARDIESDDGVANAVIAEAADRLMAFQEAVTALLGEVNHPAPLRGYCPGCRLVARYRYLVLQKDKW
jgi:hypothetical protein